jgi:hypothetical protein
MKKGVCYPLHLKKGQDNAINEKNDSAKILGLEN